MPFGFYIAIALNAVACAGFASALVLKMTKPGASIILLEARVWVAINAGLWLLSIYLFALAAAA